MAEEMLMLMDERRNYKNTDPNNRFLNQSIQQKIKEAKEKWLIEQCTDIEEYKKV